MEVTHKSNASFKICSFFYAVLLRTLFIKNVDINEGFGTLMQEMGIVEWITEKNQYHKTKSGKGTFLDGTELHCWHYFIDSIKYLYYVQHGASYLSYKADLKAISECNIHIPPTLSLHFLSLSFSQYKNEAQWWNFNFMYMVHVSCILNITIDAQDTIINILPLTSTTTKHCQMLNTTIKCA